MNTQYMTKLLLVKWCRLKFWTNRNFRTTCKLTIDALNCKTTSSWLCNRKIDDDITFAVIIPTRWRLTDNSVYRGTSSNPTEKRISKAPVATRRFASMMGLAKRTLRYLRLEGSRITFPINLTRISAADLVTSGGLSNSRDTTDVSASLI